MKKTCKDNDLTITYDVNGVGVPVVLVHGYLESRLIWGDFAARLAQIARVIAIDLPGHGDSDFDPNQCSMADYARVVNRVCEAEQADKILLAGHSMGGYVAVEFLHQFADKLRGLVLFHSTPFADSVEKRANRDREIMLLQAGKKRQIYQAHFPKTFAQTESTSVKMAIELAEKQVESMSEAAIICALTAMKNRHDYGRLLQNSTVPAFLIHGDKDAFIPQDVAQKIALPDTGRVFRLNNSGHMGFIEQPEEVLAAFVQILNELQ